MNDEAFALPWEAEVDKGKNSPPRSRTRVPRVAIPMWALIAVPIFLCLTGAEALIAIPIFLCLTGADRIIALVVYILSFVLFFSSALLAQRGIENRARERTGERGEGRGKDTLDVLAEEVHRRLFSHPGGPGQLAPDDVRRVLQEALSATASRVMPACPEEE